MSTKEAMSIEAIDASNVVTMIPVFGAAESGRLTFPVKLKANCALAFRIGAVELPDDTVMISTRPSFEVMLRSGVENPATGAMLTMLLMPSYSAGKVTLMKPMPLGICPFEVEVKVIWSC